MTRTERTYYAVVASWSVWMWFMAPVYPLFLASRGLDLFQVNLVLAIFMISVFLLEVPTGAVADLFGRKVSFVLACFTRMVAFGLYAFAQGFLDCVVAEVIDAAGQALASGALEAWAVDGVRADGDRRPADRMFARGQMLGRTMMIAGGVTAGYVADADLTRPWLVAAAGFGATGVLACLTMREVRPARRPAMRHLHRSLWSTAGEGFALVRASRAVLLLCLLGAAVGFGVMTVSMTWPARMKQLSGEGFWLLGWVWALLSVMAIAGSALAARFVGHLGRARLLFWAQLSRAVGFAGGALAGGFSPALGGLLLQEAGMGASIPVADAWLNDHVGARLRATVLSVSGMFFTLGGSLGLVCLGLVAEHAGIPAAWLVGALVLALVAPAYLVVGRIPPPPGRGRLAPAPRPGLESPPCPTPAC